MTIELGKKIRIKSTGKVGILTRVEAKMGPGGYEEKFTVRLDEMVTYWYPCSNIGEMIPGYKNVTVPKSDTEPYQEPFDHVIDSVKYMVASGVKLTPEQLGQKSLPPVTIELPSMAAPGTVFKIHRLRTDGTVEKSTYTPKACECGKEKHGFASHSTWCPKNE